MPKHIIFGAPGTGKTYSLIEIIKGHLNKGISPESICFCTYSRAAAQEAKERVMTKFNLSKESIPLFGTIHSICYKRFCMNFGVISIKQKKEFFETNRIDYKPIMDDEDLLTNELVIDSPGNVILGFYDRLRISYCKNIHNFKNNDELKACFSKLNSNEGEYDSLFGNFFDLYRILLEYEKYKQGKSIIDFIDMLLIAFNNKYIIQADILFVDEFQDLSPLQYEIYKLWSQNKKEVYIAGDDDQTIYRFICANHEYFLKEKDNINPLKGDSITVLPKTYRMLKKIHDFCLDYPRKHISKENRIDKQTTSFKDGGEIILEEIDGDLKRVLEFVRPNKFTFILTRTNYYKKVLINEVFIPHGIIYYEIRGTSIWNYRTINLFNATYKLINKKDLSEEEVKYLIENIPFKIGLLKRGLKSKFKDLRKKEKYNISDLLELGFNINLFEMLDYKKLFNIYDISDFLKETFLQTEKKIIELPIKLKIGTIHSSKGKEADDVILFKDISKKIANQITKDKKEWESEIRVFHTGQSRTRERLVILRGGFKFSEKNLIP